MPLCSPATCTDMPMRGLRKAGKAKPISRPSRNRTVPLIRNCWGIGFIGALCKSVGKIWGAHDARAPVLAAHERDHCLDHIGCIQHPVMSESLCGQKPRVVPVSGI